jgi:reactive intermediate/imine deaminase
MRRPLTTFAAALGLAAGAACTAGSGQATDSAAAATAASPASAPPAPEFLTPYGPPRYPFSPAVRVGDMLYLSGQIGTDSTLQLVPGGIEAEARQAMENIRDVLVRTGSSMDRVVKCTIFMADMREWPTMNEIYATYFPDHYPARSAFGATALALGARVEIECIAVAGS